MFSSCGTELLSYLALCCARIPLVVLLPLVGKSVKMTFVLFISVQIHKERLQLCLTLATCGFLQSMLLILISLLYPVHSKMVLSVHRATGLLEYLWMRPNTFPWKVC